MTFHQMMQCGLQGVRDTSNVQSLQRKSLSTQQMQFKKEVRGMRLHPLVLIPYYYTPWISCVEIQDYMPWWLLVLLWSYISFVFLSLPLRLLIFYSVLMSSVYILGRFYSSKFHTWSGILEDGRDSPSHLGLNGSRHRIFFFLSVPFGKYFTIELHPETDQVSV